MKRKKLAFSGIIGLITVIILFLLLHITPKMSLRTHVFFMGYPKAAITSKIVDDEFHNIVDKNRFEKTNSKAYTLMFLTPLNYRKLTVLPVQN